MRNPLFIVSQAHYRQPWGGSRRSAVDTELDNVKTKQTESENDTRAQHGHMHNTQAWDNGRRLLIPQSSYYCNSRSIETGASWGKLRLKTPFYFFSIRNNWVFHSVWWFFIWSFYIRAKETSPPAGLTKVRFTYFFFSCFQNRNPF